MIIFQSEHKNSSRYLCTYLCLARRPFFNFRLKPKVDGALRLATGDGGGLGRTSLWSCTGSSSEDAPLRFKGPPSSSDEAVVSPLKYIEVIMNDFSIISISSSHEMYL